MPNRADVARALREARDLMNGNGRHWMKGDDKFTVTEQHIALRDGENGTAYNRSRWISEKAQVGDTVFCTWGGLSEVCKNDKLLMIEAMEALVQIIDEYGYLRYLDMMRDQRDEYDAEVEYDRRSFLVVYPTFEDFWNAQLDYREAALGDSIAQWNDDDARMWEDVKTSLTEAAKKVKKA